MLNHQPQQNPYKDPHKTIESYPHHHPSHPPTTKEIKKRPVTVPYSPQFSRMSWERKKADLAI